MHRTEGNNNSNNLFTDGPPGTTVESKWLNSIQEEIAYVIEQNDITLENATTDTTYNQLHTAIQRMVPANRTIKGLNISNGTDADHDVNIATGFAYDDGFTTGMELQVAITKKLDAAWAVGSNAGGMDDGAAMANNTWYYVWLIRKDSDGSIDALISTSATSPTMPTGYTKKRRIRGVLLTNGAANIIAFFQKDDRFYYKAVQADYVVNNPGVARVTPTMSIPPSMVGIVLAIPAQLDANRNYVDYFSTDVTDVAPTGLQFDVYTGSAQKQVAEMYIKANSSSQIAIRCSFSGVNTFIVANTLGFIDPAEV
jgi:hypothetical protein